MLWNPLTSALLVVALLLAAIGMGASEPAPLTRSLYIPIEFSTCEHLVDSVLYENGQPVARAPVKRIFQFTYYPEHKKMAPDLVRVRVEGTYEDGEAFLAKLAVASDGVHTAHSHKELVSQEKLKRKLRFKRDVRVQSTPLKLTCKRFCARESAEKVAAAAAPNPQ